jgi:hypothetical protein
VKAPLGVAALAGVMAASCGAPLLKLPAGPGAPAADISTVIAEATRACRAVSTTTAEAAVTGSVGGRRLRARLLVGLASPASARLEAFAFGAQIFVFVSRAGDATLLLPRDRRVLQHGRPADVLEAVTGLPLDAGDLRVALLGCSAGQVADRGRQIGDDWRAVQDGATELYLQRTPRAGPWRVVAAVHRDPGRPAWRAEYRDFAEGLPRSVRFVSLDQTRFDLRLTLSQVDLNVTLDPAAFVVNVPPDTDPISLDELRQSGPLTGASGSNGR